MIPKQLIWILNFIFFIFAKLTAQLPPPNPPPGQTNVECVINLEITDFSSRNNKHKAIISGPTPDKVESISYKAKTPNKPPGAFDWRAGFDGGVKGFINYWGLAPLPIGGIFQIAANAYIPNAKHPINNEDLGNAHGTVMVTENGQTPGATINDLEVFFRKDDPNPNDPNVPNWFYYWSQISTENQNLVNIKFIDPDTKVWAVGPPVSLNLKYVNTGKYAFDENKVYGTEDFLTYGSLAGGNTENIGKQSIGQTKDPGGKGQQGDGINYAGWKFSKSIIINIGNGNGYYDISDKNKTGISVFSETYFHELEHWKIFYENWKDGYQSDLDLDKDGYRDEWEEQNKSDEFPFDTKNDGKVPSDKYDTNYTDYEKSSVGTRYEETRCRDAQKLYTNTFNNEDWSYDQTKKYQGKLWK